MHQLISASILALTLVAGNAAFAQSMAVGSAPTAKAAAAAKRHQATATVRKADEANGTVIIIAHGPVGSLNWPPVTMAFKVRDKALFKKLEQGKKVAAEFTVEGSEYVIVSAK